MNQITKSYSLNDVTDTGDIQSIDRNRSHSLSEQMSGGGGATEQMIDDEFRYLDDDVDDVPLSIRVKKNMAATSGVSKSGTSTSKQGTSRDDGAVVKSRNRRVKTGDVDAYATLPRRSARTVAAAAAAPATNKAKERKEL